MSQDDDLVFNPNERTVPHSMETVRPLGRQAAAPVAPGTPLISPQSTPTAAQPPAIQARQAPPRQKSPLAQAAHQLGRRNVEQVAPQIANQAVARTAAPEALLEDVVNQREPVLAAPAVRPVKPITVAFEDTWLPSNFAPYEWKEIKVRRFNIEELRALVRARVSGNLRHLVRAVDATISQYADELTVGDFWYLMYWHRLNSYKKSPFVIQWKCDNPEHIHNVVEGRQIQVSKEQFDILDEKDRLLHEWDEPGDEATGETHHHVEYYKLERLEKETLSNLLTVSGSNLTTEELDLDKYEQIKSEIEAAYNIQVTPHLLKDLIASLEQQENKQYERKKQAAAAEKAADTGDVAMFIDAAEEEQTVEDEEQAFMHRYAAMLSPLYGDSLDDRAKYMNQLDPDLLVDLEAFLEVAEHGVTESWKVKCKECGASKTVNQSLDALAFLPSLQRGGLA